MGGCSVSFVSCHFSNAIYRMVDNSGGTFLSCLSHNVVKSVSKFLEQESTNKTKILVVALCSSTKMTIHNLYMFDRHGVLMFYGEWNRKRQSGMTIEEVFYSIYVTLSNTKIILISIFLQCRKQSLCMACFIPLETLLIKCHQLMFEKDFNVTEHPNMYSITLKLHQG